MTGRGSPTKRPQVIHLLPDAGPLWPAIVFYSLVAVAGVALNWSVSAVESEKSSGFMSYLLIGGFGLVAVVFSMTTWWIKARYSARRAEFLAAKSGVQNDFVISELRKHFAWNKPNPEPEVVRGILRTHEPTSHESAAILCIGLIDIPEVDAGSFRAITVPSSQFLTTRLTLVLGICCLFLMLAALTVMIGMGDKSIWTICLWWGLLLPVVAGTVARMARWTGARRTTSLRMAPGTIEVLESQRGSEVLRIRCYPMNAGTLAILRKNPVPFGDPFTLSLSRGADRDTIAVSEMRRQKEFQSYMWKSLLGTPELAG